MTTASNDRQLKIRMYNIGFGDCFLFYIPEGETTRLMLVDFGRHISSKGGQTLSKVCADLTREAKSISGKPFFDVVVATHRHYDHIAGFDLSAAKKFEAGEVWLPWTEDPDDPVAVDLKSKQFELALALQDRLPAGDPNWFFLSNSLPDFSAHGLSNDGAMENLLGGFRNSAPRRFLPGRNREEATFSPDALPGVVVHVLGPSHDEEVIATLRPPKGEYYEFATGSPAASASEEAIFGTEYQLTEKQHRGKAAHLHDESVLADLRKRATFNTGLAARRLEDMINGTSLVLVLEVGSAVLVLGGDAEWGTWSQALKDPEWTSLLERTSLYKASHHGSYNGTPRRYVQDHMPEEAVSMVSLTPMEKWPSIPRKSLLDELDKGKRRLVRTDQPASVGGVVTQVTPLYTEVTLTV